MRRSQRWRPLLSGALRQRALDSVLGIAGALRRPPPVPAEGQVDADERAALEIGLLTGRAGIAVFFAYLSETDLFPGAEALAWQFLDEAEAGLATHRLGPSLTSGISGIAWAHDHLNRYLSGARDGGELRQIDEALIATLRAWPWPHEFDLLYGLVGIGVYALERLPARAARIIARLVVERLAEQAVDVDGAAAWWTPAGAAPTLPEGHFNLGLAHGAPGVIGFLARAAEAGVAPRISHPLLERATIWLLDRQSPADSATAFAQSWDGRGTPAPRSRTAWCYGDPGVAAGLLASARASGNAACLRDCLRIATKAAARKGSRSGVVDAGLCHGSAGLGQLFNRLWQATGKREFRSTALHWFERTLVYRHPGRGVGGFTALAGPSADRRVEMNDPGLLTGSAGIGLALLGAATSVEPAWDRLLLLDLW